MKKISKGHHSSLNELNITPLLDLAFVLLVIFIITTTPIVNDLDLDLPKASSRPKDPKPKVTYVTVQSSGSIFLNKEQVDLAALQDKLIALRDTVAERPRLKAYLASPRRIPFNQMGIFRQYKELDG